MQISEMDLKFSESTYKALNLSLQLPFSIKTVVSDHQIVSDESSLLQNNETQLI